MLNFLSLRGSSYITEYKGITEIAFGGLHEYLFKIFSNTFANNSSVLDLGSGKGAWIMRLADHGYQITGCDLNPQNSSFPCLAVNLNEQFAERFDSSRFDIITCVEVIEHLENPRNTLRQSYKLLNDQGRLFLSTPNVSGLYSRIKFFFTGKFPSFNDSDYHSMGHIRPISYWELEKMLEESGFRLLNVSFYDFTPVFPKTLGDIIKKVSWLLKPLMSGIVGSSDLIVVAEKVSSL